MQHHSHVHGPGKALRQETNVNATENEALKARLSQIRHNSVSSNSYQPNEVKSQHQTPTTQSQKPLASNSNPTNSPYNSNTSAINLKNDMEKVNLEKFNKILSANPVNLGK